MESRNPVRRDWLPGRRAYRHTFSLLLFCGRICTPAVLPPPPPAVPSALSRHAAEIIAADPGAPGALPRPAAGDRARLSPKRGREKSETSRAGAPRGLLMNLPRLMNPLRPLCIYTPAQRASGSGDSRRIAPDILRPGELLRRPLR